MFIKFQAHDSDLVNINSLEEHGFIVQQLKWQDPQHRSWYTSIKQQSPDYWVNEGDNSQISNMDNAFLPPERGSSQFNKDFLVYK